MNASSSPFAQAVPSGPTLTSRAGWMLLAWSFYMFWLGASGLVKMRLHLHAWLHGEHIVPAV